MLEKLKAEVLEANLSLPKYNLVTFTWGNVSGIDRDSGLVVIKPSGVEYEKLKLEDLVVVDLEGNIVEGQLRPSSDTKTHLVLYKHFSDIGGIVHTHSTWATIWSQAKKDLPALGTTHADTFYGTVPCTRNLRKDEIESDYELETGNLIVETFKERNIDPNAVPASLVDSHGPFTWGKSPRKALENAVVLEEVCKLASNTFQLNMDISSIDQNLLDKHYLRKHGKDAYYGQNHLLINN
ncbi:L-ribulose-5-phosphate 4-epimerase [Heyndrickxia oleronia]|uniref:L-ribulose-5-phosphate 4-epimerase n=1 Tax=Heyndrickxia oleronia TaxID=38875 RepID=A0A8E2IGG2_9BACI|nr:L-ribulose-5-phosphate 4-epimerase [Heyndrickxia oleronia]MEC1375919.1 L-ribulose-5-phosphate 4-epimerase [Heyndrickxia oleronia]OOP69496.1 L-ribulose-5-phosphate 4-epimerase [Heyndrickxia oleronia]QQZ05629.1 L-ribulose-5-phosphate 4-epimerase [Heyndrickxia oleronia]